MLENPFLYDKSCGEGGDRHDYRLQPAGQHSALPVGLQCRQQTVFSAATRRGAVGVLVMDHRADRVSDRAVGHTDRQRSGDERSVAYVELWTGGSSCGSCVVETTRGGGTPSFVARQRGWITEERRYQRDAVDCLILRHLHHSTGHRRLRTGQRVSGSAAGLRRRRMRG